MFVIHSPFLSSGLLSAAAGGHVFAMPERPNLQTISPHAGLWHEPFPGSGIMGTCMGAMNLPSVFRYEPSGERSIEGLLRQLDGTIQDKRQEAKALRDSDAPPALVLGVEEEIEGLTREFRTLVDHSNSVT